MFRPPSLSSNPHIPFELQIGESHEKRVLHARSASAPLPIMLSQLVCIPALASSRFLRVVLIRATAFESIQADSCRWQCRSNLNPALPFSLPLFNFNRTLLLVWPVRI